MSLRRLIINILALTPLLLLGYYGLPVLLDPTQAPLFQAQIVRLATHPNARMGFFIYMATFFAVAFVPVIYQQIRQFILRKTLPPGSKRTVKATVIGLENTSIRTQSGLYVKVRVKLPDGRETRFYESLSFISHVHVGDTIRVTYNPFNIKQALFEREGE